MAQHIPYSSGSNEDLLIEAQDEHDLLEIVKAVNEISVRTVEERRHPNFINALVEKPENFRGRVLIPKAFIKSEVLSAIDSGEEIKIVYQDGYHFRAVGDTRNRGHGNTPGFNGEFRDEDKGNGENELLVRISQTYGHANIVVDSFAMLSKDSVRQNFVPWTFTGTQTVVTTSGYYDKTYISYYQVEVHEDYALCWEVTKD